MLELVHSVAEGFKKKVAELTEQQELRRTKADSIVSPTVTYNLQEVRTYTAYQFPNGDNRIFETKGDIKLLELIMQVSRLSLPHTSAGRVPLPDHSA